MELHLLTIGNTKTVKGEKRGYLTFILHLAPSDSSGYQVCPKASPGCIVGCLNTSGRAMVFPKIIEARKRKTRLFFENRTEFFRLLVSDIRAGIRLAERKGLTPVFRLNGTSDLKWEKYPVAGKANIFEAFPSVQFYDYTKHTNRTNLPANYNLTFSRSEVNELDCRIALREGKNVAVVFDSPDFPATYLGHPVVSGEDSDLRFLDPKGSIIGLKAKGKARQDQSGFVVSVCR
jgi:hypothetical protein